VRDAVTKACPGEEVRFVCRTDLSPERRYAAGHVVLTERALLVLVGDAVVSNSPFAAMREFRTDEFTGVMALLAIPQEGDAVLLAVCSRAYVPEFATLRRVLADVRDGVPPHVPDRNPTAYCVTCGQPLSERGASCPKCSKHRKTFGRLAGLLRPYRSRLLLLVFLTATTVAARLAPPYITKHIIDDVVVGRNLRPMPLLFVLLIACAALHWATRLAGGTLTAWLGGRIVADLRSKLHQALQHL